jgi:hypothetical protein
VSKLNKRKRDSISRRERFFKKTNFKLTILFQIGNIEDRIKELEEKVKAQHTEMLKEEKQIK